MDRQVYAVEMFNANGTVCGIWYSGQANVTSDFRRALQYAGKADAVSKANDMNALHPLEGGRYWGVTDHLLCGAGE